MNPANPHAHERLGFIYGNIRKDTLRGLTHSRKTIALAPGNGQAHFILGRLLLQQQADLGAAAEHFSSALTLLPSSLSTDPEYTQFGTHRYLGFMFMLHSDLAKSVAEFRAALALNQRDAELHFALAAALVVQQGLIEEPLDHFAKAVALQPGLGVAPLWHSALAMNYARAGRFSEAIAVAKTALEEAQTLGNEPLTRQIRDRIQSYQGGVLPPVEKRRAS